MDNASSILPGWSDEIPARLAKAYPQNPLTRRDGYGTARFKSNDVASPRRIVAEIPLLSRPSGKSILVECLDRQSQQVFLTRGLNFASEHDLSSPILTRHLQDAIINHLDYLPGVRASVAELAWILHVLVASDDDYDVSFSDPQLPYSIFVSVPGGERIDAPLRIAEAVVHETMHLQLSLYERLSPLLLADGKNSEVRIWSPWRQEYRAPIGILHGIYVFGVLREYWLAASQKSRDPFVVRHAIARVEAISEELRDAEPFRGSSLLTDAGRDLVNGLFL